jgi:hypothetical protein
VGQEDHAFLWEDPNDPGTDLNSLLPSGSCWMLNAAWDISDAGQVVGYGTRYGESHVFVLDMDGEPDCNGSGYPDECDIANGPSADGNACDVPDECEACIGDLNCDGMIDFADINAFVLYRADHAAWQAQYANCQPESGDIDCDGTMGQSSFGDINPFVTLLTQCSGAGGPFPGPIACSP